MPVKYIALLRGINVGGKDIIKMADLKKAFEDMKCENVRTYIQSGNVIFSAAEKDKKIIAHNIEKTLSGKFNFSVSIALFTAAEMKKIEGNMPTEWDSNSENYRCDVWFLRAPLTAGEVMRSIELREGVDKAYNGKKVVYTSRLNSQMGKSYLSKIIQYPEVYQNITIRNRNTVKKITEMLE